MASPPSHTPSLSSILSHRSSQSLRRAQSPTLDSDLDRMSLHSGSVITVRVPSTAAESVVFGHGRKNAPSDSNLSKRPSSVQSDRSVIRVASTIASLQPMPRNPIGAQYLDAVIQVFTTHCRPSPSLPWQMGPQLVSSSSGFVISERRILTNYHSVEYASVVRVKKRNDDAKFIATVITYSEECDIAMLTVSDEEFWSGITPLQFGKVPKLQDPVSVIGYPVGGENICITAGVTSRIEVRPFSNCNSFVVVQIDAAINGGNSGGPVFDRHHQVIGIAYEKISSASVDSVGYIIAVEVVERFLKDVEKNGRYVGSCTLGFFWQELSNPDFRRYLKMQPDDSGVLVTKIDNRREACEILQVEDIVTSIDGVSVSNTGLVPHSSGERLTLHSIVASKFVGDVLNMSIIRDGKKMDVSYQLPNALEGDLVPIHIREKKQDYFIFAGLVFLVLTETYLRSVFGSVQNSPSHLFRLWNTIDETSIDEVVILGSVLDTEVNIEYSDCEDQHLLRFNGQEVRSLQHLCRMVHHCTDEFVRFDLNDDIIVMDRVRAMETNASILEHNQIPALTSLSNWENDGDSDSDSGNDCGSDGNDPGDNEKDDDDGEGDDSTKNAENVPNHDTSEKVIVPTEEEPSEHEKVDGS